LVISTGILYCQYALYHDWALADWEYRNNASSATDIFGYRPADSFEVFITVQA